MIILRLLANLVDMLVGFIGFVATIMFVFPFLYGIVGYDMAAAALSLVVYVCALFLAHYPFMLVGQTIGKAFFGLRIVTTNHERVLTPSIIASREVFGKLMSCYLMCLPCIIGKEGKHDEVSQTAVIKANDAKNQS